MESLEGATVGAQYSFGLREMGGDKPIIAIVMATPILFILCPLVLPHRVAENLGIWKNAHLR